MTNDLAALSDAAAVPWEPRTTFAPAPILTKARWAYLMALEREHRAGRLVQINPDGLRERGKDAIIRAMAVRATMCGEAVAEYLADAAIAAILGETK